MNNVQVIFERIQVEGEFRQAKNFKMQVEALGIQPRNESVPCYLRVRPWSFAAYLTRGRSEKLAELLTRYSLAVSRLEWTGPAKTSQQLAHR
jgi:hypothetical protein